MKSTFKISAAVTAIALATPAWADPQAQGTSAASDASSDETDDAIVVTARRREENVSKVPIAITAFSGEQLAAKGITNTLDLTRITPGLNIQAGGSKANPFLVIRGQAKAVVGTGSPGVITYMNDVPLPNAGSLIQTFDMANVQVLKGPQGTLFGRNSIGGALLTVTKAPTHDFEGYARADVAQYDYWQLEGAVNLPIVKDRIALRLAAQIGHDGGNTKTYLYSPYTIVPTSPTTNVATPGSLVPGNHNVDEFSNQSFRASLLVEPVDWIKNVTVGDYSKIRGFPSNVTAAIYDTGFNGGTPAVYFRSPAAIKAAFGADFANKVVALAQCGYAANCDLPLAKVATARSIQDRYMYTTQDPWIARTIVKGLSNTTTIDLGEHAQLKNIFAIRTTETFSNGANSGLPIPTLITNSLTNLRQTTEELQVSGSLWDSKLKYTLGGFLYNEKPRGAGGFQALEINAYFGLSHSITTTYLHNTSKAIYGQIDYALDGLIEGLSITAGLRQTWDTQGGCSVGQIIPGNGPQGVMTSPEIAPSVLVSEAGCNAVAANVLPDVQFKKLTYTAGLNWQITPDALLYAVHRRGYRAGGYNTPLIDPYLASIQSYKPETLTDWELGAKLRWRAGEVRGSLDLAVFTGEDTNTQLPIQTSTLSGANAPCVPEAIGSGGRSPNCTTSAAQVAVYAVGTPGVAVPIINTTTTDNAGKITIRGIEAAATFSPVRWLTLTGSTAYVDYTVDSVLLTPRLGTVMKAAGRQAPAVILQGQPEWTANVGATVTVPQPVLGGDLSVSADYHYSGKYRQVDVYIPATNQLDARIALDDVGGTSLSFALWGKNLTNRTNFLGGASTSPSGVGILSYILASSRTIGLSATLRFGAR
jgi:iron complex outermembrane recepter protein